MPSIQQERLLSAFSYDDSFTVIDLVLNNLRCPAGKGLEPGLEFLILPLHLDGLVAFRFPGAGEGQTALLGLIGAGLFDDDGIEHDHIFALIVKGNNALVDADHVGCHAHTTVLVGNKGVQQVLCHTEIICCGSFRPLDEEGHIFADFTDHIDSPIPVKFLVFSISILCFLRKSASRGHPSIEEAYASL